MSSAISEIPVEYRRLAPLEANTVPFEAQILTYRTVDHNAADASLAA